MKRMALARSQIAALALLAVFSQATEAGQLARKIGVGYSAGYNAPCPQPCAMCRGNWGHQAVDSAPTCCEFPMTWRTNVWNGYAYEHLPQMYVNRANNPPPYTGYYGYQAPLMGPVYPPMPTGYDATMTIVPPPASADVVDPAAVPAEPTPAPRKPDQP